MEYGTNNDLVIELQKHGFTREQALQLLKLPYFTHIKKIEGEIIINQEIENLVSGDLARAIEIVKINYPEIFT